MMRFLFGVAVGLLVAHWYYTNGESVSAIIEDVWANASAGPAHMENQDPERKGVKGKRF